MGTLGSLIIHYAKSPGGRLPETRLLCDDLRSTSPRIWQAINARNDAAHGRDLQSFAFGIALGDLLREYRADAGFVDDVSD